MKLRRNPPMFFTRSALANILAVALAAPGIGTASLVNAQTVAPPDEIGTTEPPAPPAGGPDQPGTTPPPEDVLIPPIGPLTPTDDTTPSTDDTAPPPDDTAPPPDDTTPPPDDTTPPPVMPPVTPPEGTVNPPVIEELLASALNLVIPANQVQAGESVSFTVQVSPAASGASAPTSRPTGSVLIRFQEQTCTATLGAPSSSTSSTADPLVAEGSCEIETVSAGTSAVTAEYAGDANYQGDTASADYTVVAPQDDTPATGAPAAPALSLVPASDTGSADNDNKTNDDTPTIGVRFGVTGASAPAINDEVALFLDSTEVGRATVNSGDISAGAVDITTSTLGADGDKTLTARIARDGAQSPPSAPLTLILDRTPPALTSASINGNTVTVNYSEQGVGVDANLITASLFRIITNGTNAIIPVAATVSPASKTVTLRLAAPVAQSDTVTLNYTSDPNGVRDIAGNAAVDVNGQAVNNVTPKTGQPKPPASPDPQPRPPQGAPPTGTPPTSNIIVTTIAPRDNTVVPGQPANVDATAARFNTPLGIARDGNGNLFVTDQNNFTVRRIAPDGAVTTVAGRAGEQGNVDGAAGTARFTAPAAIAVDANGNLFLIDNRNLRKITPDGTVSTLVTTPDDAAPDAPDTFALPTGVAVDANGNIFVADYLAGAIWKVSATGQLTRFAAIGTGIANLAGAGPSDIAIDTSNNLYVTDLPYSLNAGGFSSVHKVAPDGTVSTVAGRVFGLVNARGIELDAAGNLFINENLVVVKIPANGTSLTTYQFPASPAGGTITAASVAADPASGAVYFTDAAKHNVNRLAPDGRITVIAGSAGETGSADTPQ